MLVNNFKHLVYFSSNGQFKNVLGNDVDVKKVLRLNTQYYQATNGHVGAGTDRCFNYIWTTGSNSYTNEQTTYNWTGIVSTASDATHAYEKGNGFVIFVGTGDTAVTSNDYKLDTPVALDVLNAACIDNGDGTVATARTFQNNTGNDVTIKEIGLYVFMMNDKSGADPAYVYGGAAPLVMLGRKIFSNPVILENGEMYTFTYTIDLRDMTFSEVAG